MDDVEEKSLLLTTFEIQKFFSCLHLLFSAHCAQNPVGRNVLFYWFFSFVLFLIFNADLSSIVPCEENRCVNIHVLDTLALPLFLAAGEKKLVRDSLKPCDSSFALPVCFAPHFAKEGANMQEMVIMQVGC